MAALKHEPALKLRPEMPVIQLIYLAEALGFRLRYVRREKNQADA